MKTTIYITRHGETKWNIEKRMQGWMNSPLTEKGINQAKALGERLKDINIDFIYSSSSGRTMQTAEIIKGHRNIPIISNDNLRELNVGVFAGLSNEEIKDKYKNEIDLFWNKPHLYKAEVGEDFYEVRERVSKEVEKLIKKHEGKTLLLVTHAITLKSILSYFENRQVSELWNPPLIHQASLSKIIIENNNVKISMYGDTSHIKNKSDNKGEIYPI